MSALDDLRARLDASRATLLEAVRGLTERDFSADLGAGETVVDALAALARAEREAVHTARAAAGAPPRPLPAGKAVAGRPLPPQVVHDLAGARYETELLLDWLAEAAAAPSEAVRSALDGIEAGETAAAARIAGRERPGA
ncbi:MAG: hypothetical protein WC211_10730 [Dehalococcoidia bacterium]